MSYYCNPVNINYLYQFNMDPRKEGLSICREAADPSMILYHGRYYIFASMTLGVWVSDDLVKWENHPLPENLPLYDYAPDVRVMNDYVYYSASKNDEKCDYYRTKDVLNGPYEKIEGTFPFWDPNLFVDDDNRVYFFFGCSNSTPIYGVELDPVTMKPIGEKRELIFGHPDVIGYERIGEDHSLNVRSDEEVEICLKAYLEKIHMDESKVPKQYLPMIRGMFTNRPYIEGAWLDKFDGKYYLQYAFPGTEYNIYGDGVYISDAPLGPYHLAENNPYSYKPGGFISGAGHGSTMKDLYGNLWHASTMRISMNHSFERRVGIFPAGLDKDGDLFCNERYGDWPIEVTADFEKDVFKKPDFMLLSYGKEAKASSFTEGKEPGNTVDENIRTWWRPEESDTDPFLIVDLKKSYDVRGIQVNFADDKLEIPVPGKIRGTTQARYIDGSKMFTRYLLEGSPDGENYFILEDKTEALTDLSHDYLSYEDGISIRFLRLSKIEVPYGATPCISGLRVFGKSEGLLPEKAKFTVKRTGKLDMEVEIQEKEDRALGYNILFGHREDKLYHSYMIFKKKQRIGALLPEKGYFVRVDSFNENGITEGDTIYVSWKEE